MTCKHFLRYKKLRFFFAADDSLLPMKPLTLLLGALLTSLWLVSLPAVTARMALDEVRPGMTGVGVTVFEGTTREEFAVHILGILQNVMGPRRNIIVARLEGGPLDQTGVIQGMSGSPVYIDDRLVGAISYSLGSFPKVPIAGITPIEEMLAADAAPARAAVRAAPLALPVTQQSLAALMNDAFRRFQPLANRSADVRAFGLTPTEGGRPGALLRPIATPLVMNGFVPEIHQLWTAGVERVGFVTTLAGATALGGVMAQSSSHEPLQPGDPIGASLISGDLSMVGTGTVTMVDEGRVLAFGHPFYNVGPAHFPMTRASVTTLLPSLAISSKIAAIGDVIGTFDQDRATGVFGSLGPGPKLIPVTVSLTSVDRDVQQTFDIEIIEDPLFTPLLAYTSVLNTFFSWTRQVGATTYVVDGTIRLADRDDVKLHDVYSGGAAPILAASAVTAPLSTLLGNDIEAVALEGLDIAITSIEEPRTATLERVWLDADRPRAGDTVELRVLSRGYRGRELLETVMIRIPDHASDTLQIVVSDAARLTEREQLEGRAARNAESVEQIIRALNDARRNSRLYVRLLSTTPGAVVRGERQPSLPRSVLTVLESDRAGGGVVRLREATLGEWEIQTDHVVTGSRMLTIDLAE